MSEFLNFYIMSTLNVKQIKSRICDLRCKLEDLASEIENAWIEWNGDEDTESWLNSASNAVQDIADELSEWED